MSSGRKQLQTELRALACRWPNKRVYDTEQEAQASLAFLATDPEFRGGEGENVFHCPAGHWHVGRQGRKHPRGRRRR